MLCRIRNRGILDETEKDRAWFLHRLDSNYDHGIMTIGTLERQQVRTMAAGTFKAKCLAVMDEVQAKREPVIITKNGKPVARLMPIEEEKDSIFDFYAGKITILGDIESPIPSEEWRRFK